MNIAEEIAHGEGIYLSQAAKLLPSSRRARPVTLSCVLRWVLTGVQLDNGERVRLEARRLAGKWITTPGAIRRFVDRQTPKHALLNQPNPDETPTQRRRAAEKASAELEKLGI